MTIKCTKCGSNHVAPSGKDGLLKILRYFPIFAPYRCKDCWARFWTFGNPLQSAFSKIAVSMILAFFVLLYVLPQVQEDSQTDRIVKKPVVRMKIKTVPIEKDTQTNEVAETTPRAQPTVVELKPEKKPNKSPQKAELTPADPANKNDGTVLEDKNTYQSLLGIETQRYKSKYRIVLLADRPIKKYEAFFLDSPARLIIDLPGEWKNVGYSKLMINDAKVKRIRVGEHRDKLRIVLDLKSQKPISPHITESPRGLILTIK